MSVKMTHDRPGLPDYFIPTPMPHMPPFQSREERQTMLDALRDWDDAQEAVYNQVKMGPLSCPGCDVGVPPHTGLGPLCRPIASSEY